MHTTQSNMMNNKYPPLFCPRCGREMVVGFGCDSQPSSHWDFAVCDFDKLGILLEPSYRDISKYEWIKGDPATLAVEKDQ